MFIRFFTHSTVVLLLICAAFSFNSRAALGQVPTRAEVDAAQIVRLPDDPAAIIAVVGNTPILLGELLPRVNARIEEVAAKSGQEIPEDQLHFAKVNLVRGLLTQSIQNKMMRESFLLDQMGTESADKRNEADQRLAARARQMFFESELPELKKQYSTEDMNELDKELAKKGTSLAARQREFTDMMLGHLYIRGKVDREPRISIAEINEYYLANQSEFERPTRARWEQLTVLFSNFPNKEQARVAISNMGREAYFGGNLQAVARAQSQEPFASKGGLHEWTAKGSLASEILEQQIFSIQTNAMSEIIEDDQGYHIVRVLDRQEAGVTSLRDVQDEIRNKLKEEKIAESQRKVLDDMQLRIPVWSMFPDDTPNALPLPESIARYNQPTFKR
ncbi:Peptidyl-prolyl cis-trans isomerase D [Rubripirellula amarantea]|uniref:Periplasmic chaperone PpiD n=1 Tax=Rubripirellula amarantea TaxID=2527999 RepID=A0A5C5WK03_9BACT|nr:peptidyl-prolyl cis-trans isomerase [Rubripirellula amarantea]TWT50341.1 Peptidyl-prolyl cis-trans isomerase D [Rubripirellula amarantea]